MENELGDVDVEAQPDRFEGAMRLASMEMKLHSFEKSRRKTTEKLPIAEEEQEGDEFL